MKFVISTQELNYLITMCQNVASAKPPMPILSNLLIEAKNGELIITGTDLSVGLRCFTEAKILEEGSTTLPAKKFASLIRELTALNIEISTNEHHVTEIIADSSRFRLNGMSGSEFPALPDMSNATKIRVPQEKLKEMFFRTSFAVSRDDNRYALTGVFMHVDNKKARFIGTDGKKLARSELTLESEPSFTGGYILPLKAVEEMLKILQDENEATLYLSPDKIGLETDNCFLVSKLLSGEYPDVSRVIPSKTEASVSIHREELMTLLRQVSLFTAEAHHSVKFSFTNGELKLSANTMEIGEGKVSMPINYRGGAIDIAFDPAYFIDILKHSRGERISLGLTDSFNPGVITDIEGEETAGSSPLFILMPMRLSEV